MTPTEELRAEHEGILLVLDVLEKISEKILAGETVPTDHLRQILEFLRVFVDQCHHGKEEDILFPALEEAGIPRQGGPIGVMLSEHDRGRNFIRDIARLIEAHESGNPESLVLLTTPVLQYADLLRSHIWKENNVLFPIAEDKIRPEKQESIANEFEKFEKEKIGPGRHEEFHAMLDNMARTYLEETKP
ncbi:MAG: hemerythrin domain-containing protein [Desulfobacteraceae bacterium]|nr:hemerythrin domain-containing protein [Desulfobacteraceae bacterium]